MMCSPVARSYWLKSPSSPAGEACGTATRSEVTVPETSHASPDPAESAQIEAGFIRHSTIGAGSIVDGGTLDHAMLRRSVTVERDARLEHSIVMERSVIGAGAQLRRCIVDQDNVVPPGERIGFDPEADRRRFTVSEGGITAIGKGHRIS